jgi:LysM repeat protein
MKWLFVLFLAVVIFGGAAWFGYNLFYAPQIAVEKEQRGEVPQEPRADVTLPEFQAAAKLRQDGKLIEARGALMSFIARYPSGSHVDEAKDLLGEINVDILLSRTPSPEKQEYIVRPGDVLQNVARKVHSTPELIMRMNNLNGTMLHIGEKLLVSHPQFSIVIQRKAKLIVLLDRGNFFKQYHIRELKLSAKQSPKVMTRVAEVMAFRGGKRVGFGTREYVGSTRWVRLAAASYTIYSAPDASHPNLEQPPPPAGIGLGAADVEELSGLVNKTTPVTIQD